MGSCNSKGIILESPAATELPLSAFGDLRTVELSPVFQINFAYTVTNTHLTEIITVNGGTVTQADAMGIISSSTTTASISCLQSTRQATYRAGFGGLARFTTLFETGGVADTEQYAGLVDEEGSTEAFKNGYMIGFDGTTFGFYRFQNDTKFSTSLAEWDDPLDGSGASGMILDPTKLNVWHIRFGHLGAGSIEVMIQDELTGNDIIVHVEIYANKFIVPSTYMPNFHIMIYVDNNTTTTDLVIKTGSIAYFIEGRTAYTELQQPQHTSEIITKNNVTTEVALFSIRNKTTYAGKTNFIEVVLEYATAAIEASAANNLAKLRLIRNATLGGTPSWSDINTTDSIVEIDTSATTVTGGETLLPVSLAGKNDRASEHLLDLNIIIDHGETVTIAGESVASATINSSLLFKELF